MVIDVRLPELAVGWLTEFGEDPQKDPRLAKGEKRIKENPWRWVYAVGFICLCLRLSLIEYSGGKLSVAPELTTETTQIAVAGLVACWILLIIALADLKFMIIPDQFVLLLALTARNLTLRRLSGEGRTVVMVTHDIEFAAVCADRCAMLFDGEIFAEGAPRAFFSDNNFYTTAANRIARGFYDNAVTVEDVVTLALGNRQ